MEEEEDSEDKEIQKKLNLKEEDEIKTKVTSHFSRYKTITKDDILKILTKNTKTRTDVENRMIADYLSHNYEYFKKIKETSQKRFLKLINVLRFETYLPNELIININFDEDRFFIVFEGSVFVYRQNFYEKEMKLGDFCNYLFFIKKKDENQYLRLIHKNKHFGINFEEITENPFFNKFKIKKFIFSIEELEEIGQFGDGYVFGEMNLMRKKKQNMLVKSLVKTDVISVSKFDFNRILKTLEEKRLELLSERFKKKFNMFKFWSMEQLITLFNYCSYTVFHKDDYIYKQNEPSQYIYFIEKGKFEQYCNTGFSWYRDYIEYIGNLNDNLINIMLSKNPENNKKLREIYEEELVRQEKKDKLITENKIQNLSFLNKEEIYLEKKKPLEKYINTNNLFYIKKEEDELNDPDKIIKIPILTTEMPQVIGLVEPFESKRRFTSVKCLSGKIVAKKISVFDLLKLLLLYKEFKYSDKFLNLIVQKKVVLIDTIKMHLKRNATKFEKDINLKYDLLISQNEDSDKKVAATKLKGWNNGLYLDNILDTSLHLFKPKPAKIVNKEKELRYNLVHNLLQKKFEKNTKKSNVTFINFPKNKKQPFLLTERREIYSLENKKNIEQIMKNRIKKVKNVINAYNDNKRNKNTISKFKNIVEDLDESDNKKKIRKPSSLLNKKVLINNINSEMRKFTMNTYLTPFQSSKIFEKKEKKTDEFFFLKINKIRNKNNKSNQNNNSKNNIYFSQTFFNSSTMKNIKEKNIKKDNTISNLTNKLESICNHKYSFSKDNNDKNNEGYALPSIIYSTKNKNNYYFRDGKIKAFNIKNIKVK